MIPNKVETVSNFKSSDILSLVNIISNSSESSNEDSIQHQCLYKDIRWFMIWGRLIGILPLQGVFKSNLESLHFRLHSVPTVASALISCLIASNVISSSIRMLKPTKNNASQIAWSAAQSVFFLYGLFVYVFFLRSSKYIVEFYKEWQSIKLVFTKEDIKIRKHCIVIAGTLLTFAVLENTFYHLSLFPVFQEYKDTLKNGTKKTPLEVYYTKQYRDWENNIAFNPLFTILLLFANLFVTFGWNYGDNFIILMCRAFYFKFNALCEVAEDKLLSLRGNLQSGFIGLQREEKHLWNVLVQEHTMLSHLLEKFADLISPLIFATYATNIFFCGIQINIALNPNDKGSLGDALYALSFLNRTTIFFSFSLAAAKLNDAAHRIRKIYARCPNNCYSLDGVQRAEQRVTSGESIGLHGLGCYVVKKSFLLKILSVILTFEIILLTKQ